MHRLPDDGQWIGTHLDIGFHGAVGGVQDLHIVGALADHEQQPFLGSDGHAHGILDALQVEHLVDGQGGLVDHVDLVGVGHHVQFAGGFIEGHRDGLGQGLGAGGRLQLDALDLLERGGVEHVHVGGRIGGHVGTLAFAIDGHAVVVRGDLVVELLDQRQVGLVVDGYRAGAGVAHPDGAGLVIHGNAVDGLQLPAIGGAGRGDLRFDGQAGGVDLHQARLFDRRTAHGGGDVDGVVLRAVGALIEAWIQRGTVDVVAAGGRVRDFGRDLEVEDFGIARVDALHDHRVDAHRRLGRNRNLGLEVAFGIGMQDGLGGDAVAIAQQAHFLAGFEVAAFHLDGAAGIDGGSLDGDAALIVGVDRVGQAMGLGAGGEGQCGQGNSEGSPLEATVGGNRGRGLFHEDGTPDRGQPKEEVAEMDG